MTQQTSTTLKNILFFLKDEWRLSQQSIHSDNLIVVHDIQPPAETYVSSSSHHMIMLTLSDSKRQVIRMDGKEYDNFLPAREFFIQPAGCEAFYSWETNDEALTLFIKPAFMERIADETEAIDSQHIELRPLLRHNDNQIEYLMGAFLSEMQNQNLGGKIYLESLANLFLVNLLRNYCTFPAKLKEIKGGLSPYKKQQAINYIQAHISQQQLGLGKICELIGLSQFHFCREFKKSVGVTPHHYIMQQRVKMAKQVLKQQKLSIAEVAVECGFSNQSHLGRVFKQHTGTTPRRFRNG